MRLISESKTFFGIMLENPSLYMNVNIDDLKIDNYKFLEKKLKNLEIKERYLLMKLAIVKKINNDLVKKVALQIEKVNLRERSIQSDISIFESKLALLYITRKITDIELLGFTDNFINSIVDKKINEYNNRFTKYFYNENTGYTSLVDDGNYLILPYEPRDVNKKRLKL